MIMFLSKINLKYIFVFYCRKYLLDPLPDHDDYNPLPEDNIGFNRGFQQRPDQENNQHDQ